ncbi:MAG: glutathione S-transferase family protein [Alphaproteobacteria bacterium]|nr:MAG: glutathione S-transferase family protein [Alphaproteobacteria bacterium]
MLRLYDYPSSGNGYKVRLLLALLGTAYERVDLDIEKGETHTADFLARNPNGKIPVLELEDGTALPESNAILWYLAEGTSYLPEGRLERAQVLRWMFFEQYSHEPYVAVARFILMHPGMARGQAPLLREKQDRGYQALGVMEGHLAGRAFFVGESLSVADIALYAYTHVAEEGGFDLGRFPALTAWLARVARTPGYVPITAV